VAGFETFLSGRVWTFGDSRVFATKDRLAELLLLPRALNPAGRGSRLAS
jgi:hypothetical protein